MKFTEQGWQLLQDAFPVKQAIEAKYTAVLGEDGMKKLWDLLDALIDRAD